MYVYQMPILRDASHNYSPDGYYSIMFAVKNGEEFSSCSPTQFQLSTQI